MRRLSGTGVSVWLDAAHEGTAPGEAHPDAGPLGRLLGESGASGVRLGPVGPGDLDAVRELCDRLAPAHRESAGRDGLVSVPVRAGADADVPALIAGARVLRSAVDRPNLVVRLPGAPGTLAAVTGVLAEGIGVEVAAVHAPRRYEEVADAVLAGLERCLAEGRAQGPGVPAGPAALIAFGVAAVDDRVDAALDLIGSDEAKALRGRAGLAAARLAHQTHDMTFGSARWGALAAAGVPEPRLLWVTAAHSASRSAHYAEELVTAGTVSALRPPALRSVAARGVAGVDRVWRHYADAARTRTYLKWFDICLEDVAGCLADSRRRAHRAVRPSSEGTAHQVSGTARATGPRQRAVRVPA
ncbi:MULTISPECIES: transaldolase family protein [Streptomyces]|uniref:transaldolase family protein n=1 Tax=Streptomyces TaxID=1883 RepID=UPI0006EB56E9|nr:MULTISPECIES: transaldolase family protein [Streptomyces]